MISQINPFGKARVTAVFRSLDTRWLPFADAATPDLPLLRLLRLSLFQVSIAIATVLLTGTLNRVMIVELGVPTWLVALMVAIPVLTAPARALIGHRSDSHKSLLGWRRVPYIWLGTMVQFGGLAIMPFALLLLQSQTTGPEWAGAAGAALAFLLTGLGMHMTQTAGLALATDLAAEDSRPRVIALMYVMLLAGMVGAALVLGWLLSDFSAMKLIQVVQGSALATFIINMVCLWKQEPRNAQLTRADRPLVTFADALAAFRSHDTFHRLMVAVAVGAAAFSMQDVLLEPYGGEVLGLTVSQTTLLTAIWAGSAIIGFAVAARMLKQGRDMFGLSGFGMLTGIAGLSAVIFAEPFAAPELFRAGTALIGFGGGLFSVGTMLAAMNLGAESGIQAHEAQGHNTRIENGLVIGAWGAVQATALGLGIAAGGFIRDAVNAGVVAFASPALHAPAAGYVVVYHIEIALLFAGLIAIGPLVGRDTGHFRRNQNNTPVRFGLAELPG
ncbi:MAG: BCD family MFS transporter [Rhizobiaceae bacterium]|nr:BCD family MFS transporter [Rhizobiaceae bacterium]